MEDEEVVPHVRHQRQPGGDAGRIIEQIADEHDESPLGDAARQLAKRRAHRRVGARSRTAQIGEVVPEVIGGRTRRDI